MHKGKHMAEKKGNSLLETRRKNRIYIKNMIYRMEPITRTDVAEALGLTLPTITTSVNEMIAEGLLEEVAVPEDKLINATGRRPSAIRFAGNAAYAIGVELGPYETGAVLVNLHGQAVVSNLYPAADASYEKMLEQVCSQIEQLLQQAKERKDIGFSCEKLLGAGIGISGYVEREKGIVRIHRNEDWNGHWIRRDLEERLHLPVVVDNNVRLRAIGYDMSQKGRRPDSFAYFYVSRGIACPILEKDKVLTGYTSGAGEVGHMILALEQKNGEKSGGKTTGSGWADSLTEHYVEDLAGEQAIARACADEIREGRAPVLEKIVKNRTNPEISDILKAFEKGDVHVAEILRQRIEYLGIALANIVNLINPGFVVVDAYMLKNEKLQNIFREEAQKRFFGVNEEEVRIFFLPFEHLKGAKGAACDVILQLFLNM